MKLIRLYSNDQTDLNEGIFRNSINNNIIVEPNSQIGLYNLNASIGKNELSIVDSQFKVDANYSIIDGGDVEEITETYNLILKPNTYNENNIDNFIADFEFALNTFLPYNIVYDKTNTTLLGCDFILLKENQKYTFMKGFDLSQLNNPIFINREDGIVSGNLLTMRLEQGYYCYFTKDQETTDFINTFIDSKGLDIDYNTNIITKDGGFGQAILSSNFRCPFNLGSFRFQLNALPNPLSLNRTGVIIGYTLTSIGIINFANTERIDYAIVVNNDNVFGYILGGEIFNSQVQPTINDVIDVEISQGKVSGRILRGGTIFTLFSQKKDNQNLELYPCLVINDSNVELKNLELQMAPQSSIKFILDQQEIINNYSDEGLPPPYPMSNIGVNDIKPETSIIQSFDFYSFLFNITDFFQLPSGGFSLKLANGLSNVFDSRTSLLNFNGVYVSNLSNPAIVPFSVNDILVYKPLSQIIMVQLQSMLNLDSYDAFIRGNLNILHICMPDTNSLQGTSQTASLVYNAATPFYIDIKNNSQRLNIREFNIRLLDEQANPIKLKSPSSVSILIKTKDE